MKVVRRLFALPTDVYCASNSGRALRASVISVAVSVAIVGCGKHEPVAADTAAEPQPLSTAAPAANADSERVQQLEQTLSAYEAGVAKQLPEAARACWTSDTSAFRQSMENCADNACKERELLARIASLHFQQPTQQRASLQLPATPSLLAVLAPVSADAASGSPDAKLQFEARGDLIQAAEHPEHMGIAVRAGESEHVFLFDMDIGSQEGQDEVLGLVGASPTAQILVRGQRLVAPTGIPNFDPSYCRWVYQLPESGEG